MLLHGPLQIKIYVLGAIFDSKVAKTWALEERRPPTSRGRPKSIMQDMMR